MPYSSSLTDAEWDIIKPLLPQKKRTRPTKWSQREILDGILYQLKNGCNWQDLPKDLPPYSTVYWHYKQWRTEGVIEKIRDVLQGFCTPTGKKSGATPLRFPQLGNAHQDKAKWTTLMMIDSQAVKNTCNASLESKGFCFYKATNGIKRHLAVDTLGFPAWCACDPQSNYGSVASAFLSTAPKHRYLMM